MSPDEILPNDRLDVHFAAYVRRVTDDGLFVIVRDEAGEHYRIPVAYVTGRKPNVATRGGIIDEIHDHLVAGDGRVVYTITMSKPRAGW